jgi:hypothetical protein
VGERGICRGERVERERRVERECVRGRGDKGGRDL